MGPRQSGRAPGALWRELRRPWFGVAAAVILGPLAAGCTTNGQPVAGAAIPRSPTVAFESIDGPPESIFRKLVQNLSEEAEARQLAVVSREAPAQYRVRGYLAALVQGKRSTVAWVWDVYDVDHRRVLRITGEEPVGGAGRGTWAVADDQVLHRIAKSGMDRLTAFLAAPNPDPGVPPGPAERALTVAAGDDFAPESSGIFRLFGNRSTVTAPAGEVATIPAEATSEPAAIPMPQHRPPSAGFVSPAAIADVSLDQ